MFEESVSFIPSIWATMNSWFTPTVLFVFLNIMIGTIVITSSLAKQKPQQQEHYGHHHHQQQLARSPSMLQRLKSINFYNYRSPEPNTNFAQTPSVGNPHFTSPFNYEQEQERQEEEPQPQHQHQHQYQPPHWGTSPSMLQRLKSINLYNYLSQESTTLDKTQQAADTHYYSNQEQEQEEPQHLYQPPQLGRSPSILQRFKSINIYNFLSQESATLNKAQEAADSHNYSNQEQEDHLEPEQDEEEEEEEEDDDGFQDQEHSLDEIYNQLKGSNVARSKSDTKPTSGEILKKLPKKVKKSASSKSAFNHFKEEDIVEVEARRPATVKEFGNPKMTQVDDEGVDAKADDFINKFKQQLKLQRTASIIRYKEMINRGAGK